MRRLKANKYLKLVDLHDDHSIKLGVYACLGLLAIFTIVVRVSLVGYKTGDYQSFSAWYDFIKLHGLHSFKYNFSTYNPPFTYFLYIATILPVSKIVAIKWTLAFFDLIMAVSIYFLVKFFRPAGYTALVAALVSLYLPSVLLNGVFGSQFDQLYTAFMLFSLYFGLRNNSRFAWIAFGLAVAIKLQAVFMLPILAIMCFKRIYWYDIIWGIGAFLLVSLPPVLVGRSVGSILSIYPQQTGTFNHYLTANAPNLYIWLQNRYFIYFDHMGLALAVAFSLFLVLASLYHRRFSGHSLLLATTLSLYALPFLLPAMHERYFFPAGIASLVLLFAYPSLINGVLVVLAQLITIFSYSPFLFQDAPIPFTYLSIAVLAIITILLYQFLKAPAAIKTSTRKVAASKL